MAHVIDTYECEWKAAIEDEEKLQTLSHLRQQRQVPTTRSCSCASAASGARPFADELAAEVL